jgi:hypothetical protein
MSDTTAPVLQAIIPPDAVPERLRLAVSRKVAEWGYTWADVTFAGTAQVPGRSWHVDDHEQWVFAISVGLVGLGDEIVAGEGRVEALSVGRFAAGVIPATPYEAYIYERLGARGRGPEPERQSPPPTVDTAPVVPDRPR